MSHPREPPPEERVRAQFRAAGGSPPGRDMTPALGTRGEPAPWRRAVPGAAVALARRAWGDARWSYLYKRDTRYAGGDGAAHPEPAATSDEPGAPSIEPGATPDGRAAAGARPEPGTMTDGRAAGAARRMRGGADLLSPVHGPVLNPPVWTWEVPAYFWLGGIATGSSFVALACDAAGDHRSARIARLVTLGAVGPAGPLLILDLGRPERFLHMMRIFKPRSPMSMGAWCLSAFSTAAGGALGADFLGRERAARALGAATALFGTYLGSYTGALLASTAVPVWSRSRAYLGPIFVCTAVATGAATNRMVLAATGTKVGHPTRRALGTVETLAMGTELVLSAVNERRLGRLADGLEHGRPGALFRFAKLAVAAGLGVRLARGRGGPWPQHAASALFLSGGLAFRFAWVGAGRASATDDEAVALVARQPVRPVGAMP